MTNRLKQMGQSAAWRLLVDAALQGAEAAGFKMKRQPGRGLSNIWDARKDGNTQVTSIRTTRDRWIAFPPLENGTRWKTLDEADLVIVSAVDDVENPQNIDVYMFPADVVRERFDESYAARIESGHTINDDFGMWVKLDAPDSEHPSQVGAGLAADYPAIASFSIDELERDIATSSDQAQDDHAPIQTDHELMTVGDVLTWARSEIARLSGVSLTSIKLDLKIEA